jgi:saccharopine dehydrogenase-like NADP-dependent oxidoreductase
MFKVALFGAGKIGAAMTSLFGSSGRYQIKLCDSDLGRAKQVAAGWSCAEAVTLNLSDKAGAEKILAGCDAVLSALPYYCNVDVAQLAAKAGVHYFDLTEDVATTKAVSEIASTGKVFMMPQCGLAPGFISIAAAHLFNSFDKVDTVKMRVGALPIFPSNLLKYNLTWSTDGLINEYGNMCELVEDGVLKQAFPLEGYERFSLDGCEYEAFNTSGGLGTLCETLKGRVRCLDYKTARYPGHRDLVAFLMNDLRFNEDRETLKRVFERSIPATAQDKCIIFVEARGWVGERFVQKTYASTIYNTTVGKEHLSAIQLTTASGICAPVDMVLTGKLKVERGFVRCEQISLTDFLDNEFGRYYRDEKALSGISAAK